MRLRRLDLVRYGKFTDRSIDFGDREAGRPDLHIVYGPNEAGKSTALSAFIDLLFGIETRSRYDFLHPYPTMRIGGTLQFGEEIRQFARIKRPRNSLLDEGEQPVAESAILSELGGIDREAFRTMFSLDDETLEAGGESILASRGDLGQLLFSASAGLADLSRSLGDLRIEADGFYRYRSRSGMLADMKQRLADLRSEREKTDTLAADYARLVEARDRAAEHYEQALAECGRIRTRLDAIQRLLGALPRLEALRHLRARLALLADLPDAPRSWSAALPSLKAEGIGLKVKAAAVADEIERLSPSIDGMVVDADALRLAPQLEGLAQPRSRYLTAEEDLPSRRLSLADEEARIAGLLRRLGRGEEADPGRLVLATPVTGRLRALIENRSGIEAALLSASAERAAGLRRLDEARAKLEGGEGLTGGEPAGEVAKVRLYAALASARAGDHAVRRRLAERRAAAARTQMDERLRTLDPWEGDAESLAELRCPVPVVLERWALTLAESRKRHDQHAAEAEAATTELRRLEAEREAIGATVGIVTDEDAAAARRAREEAWAMHRRNLDAASADSFEAVLRRDDAIAASRFGHVTDIEALHQLGRSIAVAKARRTRADELRDAAGSECGRIESEVAAAAGRLSHALGALSLPELQAWLVRRGGVLESREDVRAADRDMAAADADARLLRDNLASALAGAGAPGLPDAGLDMLMTSAQIAIDRETEARQSRDRFGERQREQDAREQALEIAADAETAWSRDWVRVCSGCWLGADGGTPDRATVREMLSVLADLGPALEARDRLADRIAKMEKDQADFERDILRLAAETGAENVGRTAAEVARWLDVTIRKALDAQARRGAEVDKMRDAQDRKRALAEELAIHWTRVDGMIGFFGVSDLDEVDEKLRDVAARDDLRRQASEAERDILAALRLPTMTDAESDLDGADQAALETEQAECRSRFDDIDQRRLEFFSASGRAREQVEAIGGDSKVAEIEERRRTLLLEIEEGAVRYLKLRLGIVAAEHALRAYRDRHRSSMMASASAAFSTISRGAYTGLASQPGKEAETLIAIPSGGGSKEATALSKGTRFQLYLALRVAGYSEIAKSGRRLPFVADDIMETFDDFRAEEVFRLFAAMARDGQVIYLTHHRHLCALARSVCGDVKIHDLGEP